MPIFSLKSFHDGPLPAVWIQTHRSIVEGLPFADWPPATPIHVWRTIGRPPDALCYSGLCGFVSVFPWPIVPSYPSSKLRLNLAFSSKSSLILPPTFQADLRTPPSVFSWHFLITFYCKYLLPCQSTPTLLLAPREQETGPIQLGGFSTWTTESTEMFLKWMNHITRILDYIETCSREIRGEWGKRKFWPKNILSHRNGTIYLWPSLFFNQHCIFH